MGITTKDIQQLEDMNKKYTKSCVEWQIDRTKLEIDTIITKYGESYSDLYSQFGDERDRIRALVILDLMMFIDNNFERKTLKIF